MKIFHIIIITIMLMFSPLVHTCNASFSPVSDNALGKVAGGPDWANRPKSNFPNTNVDTSKWDKVQKEDLKRREQYAKDCYSHGIEPKKEVLYGCSIC